MSMLFVQAYYGPCNTFDSCIHKPGLLHGLRDRLQKLGFRVNLIPVNFINYCMLEMGGHEVFRCNLTHLKFNTTYKRDPVCTRAVEAVMTSAVKIRRARSCLWFWTALDHQLFRRHKESPKDFWPVDVDWNTLSSCPDCIKCCNILVNKKEHDDNPEKKFI